MSSLSFQNLLCTLLDFFWQETMLTVWGITNIFFAHIILNSMTGQYCSVLALEQSSSLKSSLIFPPSKLKIKRKTVVIWSVGHSQIGYLRWNKTDHNKFEWCCHSSRIQHWDVATGHNLSISLRAAAAWLFQRKTQASLFSSSKYHRRSLAVVGSRHFSS